MQLRRQVDLVGLTDGSHVELIPQDVIIDGEDALDGVDALGSRSAHDACRTEVHGRLVDAPRVDLGDSCRLGDDELDEPRSGNPQVARLHVQRFGRAGTARALPVGEEWLWWCRDLDVLGIGEAVDRGVYTASRPLPGANKKCQRCRVWMDVGHRS